MTRCALHVQVWEGNCIMTGQCSPQLFVYNPGTYSATNEDFVRNTVTDFYELYNANIKGDTSDALVTTVNNEVIN